MVLVLLGKIDESINLTNKCKVKVSDRCQGMTQSGDSENLAEKGKRVIQLEKEGTACAKAMW